jgi:hypothetical protein
MKGASCVFTGLAAALVSVACVTTAPHTVGNNRDARIIVERIDGYADIPIEIQVLYKNLKENDWYMDEIISANLVGSAYMAAEDGNYKIRAVNVYKTGQKGKYSNGTEYDITARIFSSPVSFSVKEGKRFFYVEYIPESRDILITEGDADDGGRGGFIDAAVDSACAYLLERIPRNARVAILNVATTNQSEGDYIISELSVRLVNSQQFNIVDRKNLDLIRAEQDFQLTGEVDDSSAVSIGKMLGAEVVITGGIEGQGNLRRLRLKALDVSAAVILGISSDRI